MRPIQFSANSECYYCGASPPCSREHVPPRTLFTGFVCDSITVPSCDRHNSEKSGDDHAVLTCLMETLRSVQSLNTGDTGFPKEVVKAIKIAESNFFLSKNVYTLTPVIHSWPDSINRPVPYIKSGRFLQSWLRQLTAGIIWSAIGRHESSLMFEDSIVLSPVFWPASKQLEPNEVKVIAIRKQLLRQDFNEMRWIPGWSAHPRNYPKRLYRFAVSFPPFPDKYSIYNFSIRHIFYDELDWFVFLSTSASIRDELEEFNS